MIEELEKAFLSFMEEFLPGVEKGSPEWFRHKLAFMGGYGAGAAAALASKGATEKDVQPFIDAVGVAFSICQFQILASQVPAEHRVTTPSGEPGYTEAGTIHLFTLLEQANPDDAERIRRTRYALQKKFREARRAE